jgi:AraC-like DNA-binding protein
MMIRITSPLAGTYDYTLSDLWDLGTNEESIFNYSANWGDLKVQPVVLTDIMIFDIDISCKEDLSVTVEINSLCLMMNFILSGRSLPVGDDRFIFEEGQHHSIFSSGYSKFTVGVQDNFKFVCICFLEGSLKRIVFDVIAQLSEVSEIASQRLILLQSSRPTTPQMSDIIQSMMYCIHKKGNHHIYFEAKALELLFLELDQLETISMQSSNLFLKEHDLERIHQAKMIVEKNLLNPCSLIELAHKVGLNDFKLKKGFREVLGTTVFSYLYDLRMEKAKMLLTGGRSVREVAYEVGYKNAHHFTKAFKKKFGYLPSGIKKLTVIMFFSIGIF